MSLSIVRRPNFLIITSSAITATVSDASGDALFTKTTHGLSTGNFVYITSDFESYNGFWYVQVISGNTFKIREYATAAFVGFINDGSVSYYTGTMSASTTWVCVHLPVIYKLQSDVWPVNGVDTARTVSSFANYNGYTYLTLSGTLHTGSTVLESVTIVGTASLDGIYRIINWISASNIVIDLAYDSGNSFSGGTVQYYYMNYHAVVRVFAGLQSGHTWEAQKPMAQVAEIKCLPDATGLITVNINEFLKKQIRITSNNLLLDTLPNNIDAFCIFYIEFAESYDDSDGYTVSEFTSSFTSDAGTFLGRAVNAKLPFKSRYMNVLSDFIGVTGLPANYLTNFSSPTLTPGKYFDLSFLIGTIAGNIDITRSVYVAGVLKETFLESLTFEGIGVYRLPVSQSGWTEDQIKISIATSGIQILEEITIEVDNEVCATGQYITWLNNLGGFDYWNFTAKKTSSINVLESRTQVKNIFTGWPNSYGEHADTIRQNTFKSAQNSIRVESGNLTVAQVDGIKGLFSSPLVQIVDSASDKRTIIVDTNSVVLYNTQDNIFTVAFDASYTDDIPSQSL